MNTIKLAVLSGCLLSYGYIQQDQYARGMNFFNAIEHKPTVVEPNGVSGSTLDQFLDTHENNEQEAVEIAQHILDRDWRFYEQVFSAGSYLACKI